MPSKDTIPFHITKGTLNDIEQIRITISKELGVPINQITKKHAEIALRMKARRGKVLISELRDILLGRIK